MGNLIRRIVKATLRNLSDEYIDFIHDGHVYFAFIDKDELNNIDKDHYDIIISKFRLALINDTKVNLILERKAGKYNKKQLMDYVIKAEFW